MSNFDALCAQAGQAQTLSELFTLWKKAHNAEEDWRTTAPKVDALPEEFKVSFCPDGVTGAAGGAADMGDTVDVLFLLKEAHLNPREVPETKDTFWFNCEQNEVNRIFYMKRFSEAMAKLPEGVETETFGYMNLNKRGGGANTDPTRLSAYTKKYSDFIRREIELLGPKIILCCGCFDAAAQALGLKSWKKANIQRYAYPGAGATVIHIYHPRARYPQFKKGLENIPDKWDDAELLLG